MSVRMSVRMWDVCEDVCEDVRMCVLCVSIFQSVECAI